MEAILSIRIVFEGGGNPSAKIFFLCKTTAGCKCCSFFFVVIFVDSDANSSKKCLKDIAKVYQFCLYC
jgi:hypothetical protein